MGLGLGLGRGSQTWSEQEAGEARDEATDLAGEASSAELLLAGDLSEAEGDAAGDSSSAANCTLGAPSVLPRPLPSLSSRCMAASRVATSAAAGGGRVTSSRPGREWPRPLPLPLPG